MQMAQLDVLNLVRGIQTEREYTDFRNMLARYFADKAQKQIDALWEKGTINEQTIEQWGNERMRTPYRYAVHRSWYQLFVAGIAFQQSISQDSDDNKFVDCAVALDAEYIVTNHKHFNPLKTIPWPKVEIIKIVDFIKLI